MYTDSVGNMAATDAIERLGVFAVGVLAQRAGWFFRELPRPDHGVDALIEAQTDGRPTGEFLGVQVKSGKSRFDRQVPGGWRYYASPRERDYWLGYSVPVLLVLWHPDLDRAFWQPVTHDTLVHLPTGNYAVDVPEAQELAANPTLNAQLVNLARVGLPPEPEQQEQALRGRRAELDIGWIESLAAGDSVFLEAEQQLCAGSSGRGHLRLVAESPEGDPRVERAWPWAFLPGDDYANELSKLFPWADLSIDRPLYARESYPEFLAQNGDWDAHGECFDVDDDADFADWLDGRFPDDQIRPYATLAGGERALWRLELKLNDLGNRTLQDARDQMQQEAWEDVSFDDYVRDRRAASSYFGTGHEAGWRHEWVDVLGFGPSEDDLEGMGFGEDLWSDAEKREALARQILNHAFGEQTDAAVAAFQKVLDAVIDPAVEAGRGWELPYAQVLSWKHEVSDRPAE